MKNHPPVPLPRSAHPEESRKRPLAAHVQAAAHAPALHTPGSATGLQPRAMPGSRALAAHVQAAVRGPGSPGPLRVSSVQPRAVQTPRPLAAHVQAAVQGRNSPGAPSAPGVQPRTVPPSRPLATHVQKVVQGPHAARTLPASAVQTRAIQPSRPAGARPQPGFHQSLVIQRARVPLEEAKKKILHQLQNYLSLGLQQQDDWSSGLHGKNEDWVTQEDAKELRQWWDKTYPGSKEKSGIYLDSRHRGQNPYQYPMLLLQARDNVGAPLFNFHIPVIPKKDEEAAEKKRLLLEEELLRKAKESMFLGSSSTGVDPVWEDVAELKEKKEEVKKVLAPTGESTFEKGEREHREKLQKKLVLLVEEKINPALLSISERQKDWRELIRNLSGERLDDHAYGFNFWERERAELDFKLKNLVDKVNKLGEDPSWDYNIEFEALVKEIGDYSAKLVNLDERIRIAMKRRAENPNDNRTAAKDARLK